MTDMDANTEHAAPYPRIKNAVFLLFLLLGLQLVLGFILGLVLSVIGLTLDGLSLSIVSILSFAAVILVAIKKMRVALLTVIDFSGLEVNLILPVLVSCCGFSILLSEINNLTQLLLPMRGFWATFFRSMFIPGRIASSLVLFVVVAPLTEELLFRRIILDGFLRNYRVATAILLSSAFFGFMHLNPWQFITAFLLALYLSWLYLKTRSLSLCILAHAINNLIPLIVIGMVELEIPGYSGTSATGFQPPWFDSLGVILACAGIYLTYRMLERLKPETQTPRPVDPK